MFQPGNVVCNKFAAWPTATIIAIEGKAARVRWNDDGQEGVLPLTFLVQAYRG
jgi:hypothetical protein